MFKLSRSEQLIILFLVGVILVGSAVAGMRKYLESKEREHLVTAESAAQSLQSKEEPLVRPKEIIIHITGAVKKPGVYQFKEGARIIEAIKAAGGAKKGALLDILNLAKPMEDGSRIVVPQKFDVETFRRKLRSYGPEHVYTTEELKLAYGEFKKEEKAKEKKEKTETGKINLNTATKEELQTLSGIGPKRAEAIIANRPYSSPEEITKIHGIGPKIYEVLKDKITVD
jgi:competence protein ComEA